jgi:hypothetical protein
MSEKVSFSLNLVDLALNQLDFLEFIDKSRIFYSEVIASRAAHRYEKYWLPFYDKMISSGENPSKLCPPYDIAWIWHCHLLSPTDYRKDCENVCGRVLDHFCFSKNEIESKQQYTKRLWDRNYQEPFYLDESETNYAKQTDSDSNSKIGYNLVASSNRQKKFYYNVSLPHFRSKKYLALCLKRYERFLFLKIRNPKLFIVPCYGIDIIWHTHQLNPIVYEKECTKYLGRILPHDDTSDDRSPDSNLTNSFNMTKEAWLSEFKEKYNFAGGMYRGEAPYFCSDFSMKQIDFSPFYTKYGFFKLEEVKYIFFSNTTFCQITKTQIIFTTKD